jgi:hypothetical protein
MALRYDIYTEMLVTVGGKEEVRRIDHFEAAIPFSKAVPELNQGEEAFYGVDGSVTIVKIAY